MFLDSLRFELRGQPRILIVVAALWFVGALFGAMEMAILFGEGRFTIHVGVINLLFAWGILLHNRAIRNVALVLLWLGVIAMIATVYWLLDSLQPGSECWWKIFPGREIEIPLWIGIGVYVVWVLLNLWQIQVLCRPEIAKLFPHFERKQPIPRPEAERPVSEPGWWAKYY